MLPIGTIVYIKSLSTLLNDGWTWRENKHMLNPPANAPSVPMNRTMIEDFIRKPMTITGHMTGDRYLLHGQGWTWTEAMFILGSKYKRNLPEWW